MTPQKTRFRQSLHSTVQKGFEQMGRLFKEVDQQFKQVNQRLDTLEGRVNQGFSSVEQKLSAVIVEVTHHSQVLETLVTREEFNHFKNQSLTNQDGLAAQLERLEQEQAVTH